MGIFLIVLGILGIVWCLLPFFMYGIVGIGNITGICCFTVLAIIGVFWKRLMARKAVVLAGKVENDNSIKTKILIIHYFIF